MGAGHSHSHDHGHSHAPADFGRAFAMGVALNSAFVLIEAGFGLWSGSMALVADAGHNLSDVLGLLIENVWGKRRIMEVYLNVAETGIGTYGVEAGSQRYFGHSAARLSQSEAARMAAALPLPKERPVLNPTGFTRRYGNTIQARIGVVRRDGLDACVYD